MTCLVCDGATGGREWCSKRCRDALRALGRALAPGVESSSSAAVQAGAAHRRATAEAGLSFPWELIKC